MATGAVASGVRDNVLVVGAEVLSRVVDWEDRSTAILFGDGAGAAVVSTVKGSASATAGGGTPGAAAPLAGILGFDLGGDGRGADALAIPAGGSRMPATCETVAGHQHYLHMNGKEVYKFATRVVTHSATRVLDRCGYEVADVDLFVPHQANLRIIEGAVEKLGLPWEKVYTNVQKVRQHLFGLYPALPQRGPGGRASEGRRSAAADGVWCWSELGRMPDEMGRGSRGPGKRRPQR